MFRAYNYFNIFSAPLACVFAIDQGPAWTLSCFALAFLLHPIADWLMNRKLRGFVERVSLAKSRRSFYELPILLAVPFQALLLAHAFNVGGDSLSEAVLSGALCGLSGGILGIATAHELIHRSDKWSRLYGKVMLFIINYPHFYVEHLWHHVSVATSEDADTAREGESVYKFFLRSVPQGWLKCWTWAPYKQQMLSLTSIQFGLFLLCILLGGINALAIYLVQGLVTLLLLKWINYVEHYGLERKMINGQLEPVSHTHSWDSLSPLTNFSLFNLGFHSYHHKRSTTEYYHLPESSSSWNSLPYGYSLIMLLTLAPAAWKNFMRKQLQRIQHGHA